MSAAFCDFTKNGNSGFITYAKIGRCTLPVDVRNNAIFHAGPIIRPLENDKFEMVSVGPTTSMRMEKFEYEFVKETGVRVIIGKGGMKENTERACKEFGAIHCVFPAGNAVVAAIFTALPNRCSKDRPGFSSYFASFPRIGISRFASTAARIHKIKSSPTVRRKQLINTSFQPTLTPRTKLLHT